MEFVPCPGCQKMALLPTGTSRLATIQCPSCEEQFVIDEALERSFPQFTVLSDPGWGENGADAAQPTEEALGLTIPESPVVQGEIAEPQETSRFTSSGLELESSYEDDAEVLELKSLDEVDSKTRKPKVNWTHVTPHSHEGYEKLKRETKSPIWSVAQVVLGGLAAIPISLLLIWHLVGTDIAGAGPWVAQYAPWIVPEKFRPYENSAPASSSQRPPAPNRGDSGFRNFDEVLPMSVNGGNASEKVTDANSDRVEPSTKLDSPNAAKNNNIAEAATTVEAESMDTAVAPSMRNDSKSDGSANESIDSLETDLSVLKPATPRADAIDSLTTDLNNSPSNLFEQIRNTEFSLAEWRSASENKDELPPIAKKVYGNFTNLANSISKIPSSSPVLRVVRDEMKLVGKNVKENEDIQDLIRQGSSYMLSRADSQQSSLAVVIKIGELQQIENMWKVVPTSETNPGSGKFNITIPRTIAPSLSTDQRLLILGLATPSDATKNSISSNGEALEKQVQFTASYIYGL